MTTARTLSHIVSQQTGIYLGTSRNTTEPVVVGAIGRGAESSPVETHGVRNVL
jgi:hypothetical protein